nr:MAG TPA: hypothetical protein [Caudoviricetes sp.]
MTLNDAKKNLGSSLVNKGKWRSMTLDLKNIYTFLARASERTPKP